MTAFAWACFFSSAAALAATISTVPIGSVGNAPDPQTGYGAVSYNYRIGTTEVTNSQYVAFLNAKAASDPLELYNPDMGSNARGGITRSGTAGSYSYATKENMGNKPVNYVSWYDTIRFANWLNNGQGSGDTETGAYTLLGGTPMPSNGPTITRNSGATWFLPSENEWYKAAYHQPASQGGDLDDYWFFPTGSNTPPTIATANTVGDISNPGPNVANQANGADWNGEDGNVTTVGSAGPASKSYYGTDDQAGNVYEWNDNLRGGGLRILRGSSWGDSQDGAKSWFYVDIAPTFEDGSIGFRVATVPEPGSIALALLGLVVVIAYGRRTQLAR